MKHATCHSTGEQQIKSQIPPTGLPTKQTKKEPTLTEAYKKLNPAECRVLEKLVESGGKKTNCEIAEELFLTPKSVENYTTRIGRTLELQGKGRVRGWASK